MGIRPGYIRLYETGELFQRVSSLRETLNNCSLCPRRCGVDRLNGERGVCRAGRLPFVSAAHPHFGEEPPLAGFGGSGTIFLTYCNLRCIFCQNYDISHTGTGRETSVEELSSMMVSLQRQGCHNINFVTPTHQIAAIVEALPGAIATGLEVPLVYNCGGYEEAGTIKLLDGIFDIYMPDIKYSDNRIALELSGAPDYFDAAKAAVLEMHRQVGDLSIDKNGIARKGLIVRHLVLPGGASGTREVMRFIAREVSPDTYVNIMDQYRPAYRAYEDERVSRRITVKEFEEAVETARYEGLRRVEGA